MCMSFQISLQKRDAPSQRICKADIALHATSYLFTVSSAQLRGWCDVWLALRTSLQSVQHALHAAYMKFDAVWYQVLRSLPEYASPLTLRLRPGPNAAFLLRILSASLRGRANQSRATRGLYPSLHHSCLTSSLLTSFSEGRLCGTPWWNASGVR